MYDTSASMKLPIYVNEVLWKGQGDIDKTK